MGACLPPPTLYIQAPSGNLSTTGVWWRDAAAGLTRTVTNYTCVPKPSGGGCSVITISRQWNYTAAAGNRLYIWQQHDGGPPTACTELAMPTSAVLPPVIAADAVPGDPAPCPAGPRARLSDDVTDDVTDDVCTEWSFADSTGQRTSVWVTTSSSPARAPGRRGSHMTHRMTRRMTHRSRTGTPTADPDPVPAPRAIVVLQQVMYNDFADGSCLARAC